MNTTDCLVRWITHAQPDNSRPTVALHMHCAASHVPALHNTVSRSRIISIYITAPVIPVQLSRNLLTTAYSRNMLHVGVWIKCG